MMRRFTVTLPTVVLLAATPASAGGPILVVTDGHGAAARVGAPVSVDIDLAAVFDATVKPEYLQLIERIDKPAQSKRGECRFRFQDSVRKVRPRPRGAGDLR